MKLKNCPFCGGEAEAYDYEAERDIYDPDTLGYVDTVCFTKYGVYCTQCNCMTAEYKSEEQVIEAWNGRKPIDKIVEQLIANSGIVEDGDGHAGHVIFTEKAIEIVKSGGAV